MKYKFIVFLILLIFIISIKNRNIEHFNNIEFVLPVNSYNTIINSKYFNTFNKNDFKVRNCKNIEECKKLYKFNLIKFNDYEKESLIYLINKANLLIKEHSSFYNIKWKLCKTTDNIEEGMPHTHGDIIFLSHKFFDNPEKYKIRTLIHEKIHIYQRKYPHKTQELYKFYNFKKNKIVDKEMRRANPDLDGNDYDYNGTIFYMKYIKNPNKLSDSNVNYVALRDYVHLDNKEIIKNFRNQGYQNEHPNEIFGCMIADKIVGNNLIDLKLINYLKYN